MKEQQSTARTTTELTGVARHLLLSHPEARIFAFYGKMAAGKTTFIKSLCRELGVEEIVTSPTFSIINEYNNKRGDSVYHFDFYRINHSGEAYDIGFEDFLFSGSYCLIEWPEKIEELLPENSVKVNIEVSVDEKTRNFRF